MERYIGNLVNLLIENSIIKENEKEIYIYSIEQLLLIFLNIVTTIGIGCIWNVGVESVVFMIAYIPLRSYAGGYHARTKLGCYIFSILMILIVIWIMQMPIWIPFVYCIAIALSSAIIVFLAPVEDLNKPLEQAEKYRYKKYTFVILIFLVIWNLVFIRIGQFRIVTGITVALVILSAMLIGGRVKNKIYKKRLLG